LIDLNDDALFQNVGNFTVLADTAKEVLTRTSENRDEPPKI